MKRKLYLHVGAQKTGTTSIQAALHENRESLKKIGYCYPEVEQGDGNKVSHYNSFRGFFSRREDQRSATCRFVERVNQAPYDLILSAECLSAWPPREPGQKLPALWEKKRSIAADIRDSFPNRDVTVVLFTRSAPQFLQSLYGQYLKVTEKPDTAAEYDAFLSREGHLADFASEIQTWQSVFGDVSIVNYDKITSSVAAFCIAVGLPILPDRRENISPT